MINALWLILVFALSKLFKLLFIEKFTLTLTDQREDEDAGEIYKICFACLTFIPSLRNHF